MTIKHKIGGGITIPWVSTMVKRCKPEDHSFNTDGECEYCGKDEEEFDQEGIEVENENS